MSASMSEETIGQRLKRLRRERGLSHDALAIPGCSATYICFIERERRMPSVRVIRLLAERLGVSAHYLETGEDEPDLIGELYAVADEIETDMLSDLRRRAGQTWECQVCELGWTNGRDDEACTRCQTPRPQAEVERVEVA